MPNTPESISYIKIGDENIPIDAVTVNGKSFQEGMTFMPDVSSADNNKILMVLQGQWTLFDPTSLYEDYNGIPCGTEIDYENSYLTLEILSPGTVKWNAFDLNNTGEPLVKTIQYSINGGEWTTVTSTTSGETINVSSGDEVRIKGTNTGYASTTQVNPGNKLYSGFGGHTDAASTGTAEFNVYGNIMSLIYGDNFANQTTFPSGSSYNFCCLFDGARVVSAKHLILPAMTLSGHCYRAMFANCPTLIEAPALPATNLATSCYRFMFQLCSFTTAPELPALVVPDSAYYGLFSSCSNLNYIKCMAMDISANHSTDQWVENVAASGTFVKDVNMNDWEVNDENGIPVGWTVTTEGTVINVTSPTISFDNNTITITCSEAGTEIYYRLGTTGDFAVYSTPIEISETTTVYAYSRKSYVKSSTVNRTCQYVAPLVVSDPVISFSDNTITITCSTSGAAIYYRLGTTGEYQAYSVPIEINEDVTVYAYASLSGTDSNIVNQACQYVAPYEPGDSDSEGSKVIIVSDPVIAYANNIVTISCDTVGATIYYKLGENGSYQTYTTPITLKESETVYAYASLDGFDSDVVSESCTYDYSLDYLTFDILTSGTILWDAEGTGTKTIEYSINDGSWTSVTSTTSGVAINVTAGDSVRFRGSNTQYCNANKNNYSRFGAGTATFNISGNIMSMTSGDNFANVTTLPAAWTFTQFFKESKPVSAENLVLPADTMTESCYRAMFSKCTTLTTPPTLPATTLGTYCYYYMFENCAITKAPDLLAPTLKNYSYSYMFTGCSSLNYIKCLATTKSATNCLQNWVSNVAASGIFVKDENTTWTLNNASGIPTGWTVFDNEVIENPVITFNGENKITITCETAGADIYYRLGTTGNFTLYTGVITINDDTTVYAYASKDGQDSETVSQNCTYSEHIYTFAGLTIAPGPLYYGSNGYEIQSTWNIDSYDSIYGKSVGSTYFNYVEMGELFEKTGFSASDGDIENVLDPFDGWRLPSQSEWASLVDTTRSGSTVNNTSNTCYALVDVTGVGTGLLIFPDGETITGATLTYVNGNTYNTGLSSSQLDEYISNGCMFLPTNGYYDSNNNGWVNTGSRYASSVEYSSTHSYHLAFSSTSGNTVAPQAYNKNNTYAMALLVKNSEYGEETPFEYSTKPVEVWTI